MPIDTFDKDPELSNEHDIALIGMACKFPGADNPEAFWKNILSETESIHFFNHDELIDAGIDPPLIKDSSYVAARGILTDVDKFDADFFGYSASEASITDPQHRVFLEQSWTALENAGYTTEQFSGRIGVFAGMSDSTYLQNNLLQNHDFVAEYERTQALLATSIHYLTTKVAYSLGLTGPCVNVSTACSTSLVAIGLACESLNNYDCDMALAGGITINTPQHSGYEYRESGILSPDGHCRTFDKNAQGTVFSNGCGIAVLKRLSDAIECNDNIIAVIKGWAINNDGSDKAGFTAPSVSGQAICINQAMSLAGVKPSEIDYVEAHGTGTTLGDPIEIAALTQAYEYDTDKNTQYCAIGSVKTNIGHTDVASGIAGFIKTALALREKILPANLHYTAANEKIDFSATPFYVNDATRPWLPKQHKRNAAINSLGFGGTNAHAILQEAPVVTSTNSKSANSLLISAKTIRALNQATTNLLAYLQNICNLDNADQLLADSAYTLQLGRKHFKYRRAIAYQDCNQLLQELSNLDTNFSELNTTQNSRIIFIFPGQGAQYANMALDIYQQHPFFRQIVDNCCKQISDNHNLNLKELLFPTTENIDSANQKLRHTQYAQPALFIIEYALARLLIEMGINPTAMIGHSIGEYVAATISGVLDFQSALTLIMARANLMAKTPPGAMLAVPLAKEKLVPLLPTEINLAAHNGPELCIVSGAQQQILDFEQRLKPSLEHDDLSCTRLHTSHAFHSFMMDEILEEFSQSTDALSYGLPQIPYISNVTGNWLSKSELEDKNYWTTHLRQTVRFSEGINALALTSNDMVIEVGPGKTLTHLIRQHQKNIRPSFFAYTLPSHNEAQSSNSYFSLMKAISQLWLWGKEIRWKNLYGNEIRKRQPLPTYPFERRSYWVTPDKTNHKSETNKNENGLLYSPIWERELNLLSLKTRAVLPASNTWLIFSNGTPECDSVIQHLKLKNHLVYTIRFGDNFKSLDDFSFVIAADNKDDYLQLFKQLKIKDETIITIHAGSLNNSTHDPNNIFNFGALSLLYLSQAFTEMFNEKKFNVLVLANHVYSVIGNELVHPEKAAIVGPCKVIPQEQTNITFKFIDLELVNANKLHELASCLYWEANTISREFYQTEIAYRGSYRWIKSFKLCEQHINTNRLKRIKNRGVYLITGGLGGIGLSLAQYLAKHYQANLVLISRSTLLPENQWQEYLEDDANKDTKLYKQISTLNTIKQNADSLIIEQASVDNEVHMSTIINTIYENFGHLDGVIHAAGVAAGGVAQLKTATEYKRILNPKAIGTQNLFKLLKDKEVDFIVLVSSIMSIAGFPGQIDYCSANLVLDAYATSNFFTNSFCVSMNWQAWRDVGMAAESKSLILNLNENNSTSPEDAVLLFEKIVNSDLNQVVISGIAPDKIRATPTTNEAYHENDHQADSDKISISQDKITETLVALWKTVLGVDEISLHDKFEELGGHSLLAISLLEKIHKKLGVKITLSNLYRSKTIHALSNLIQSNIREKDTSPLILLQKGENQSPLFIVHPVGGTVFCYSALVRNLHPDKLVYGLQDPSIDQEKPLFNTIEEMATCYSEAIQKVQPVGPYYLCGSSFGATVTMEIAFQLLQKNERIAFIGLLDGWATFSTIQRDIDYVKNLILRHQKDENSNVLPRNIENQQLWEDMLEHRITMMLKYSPHKLPVEITLIKPNETLIEYQDVDVSDNHWADYSTLPINVVRVPGNHDTMLQEPHVKSVANIINNI